MKVLITGATGFIGKVIVRKLLEKDYEVIVLTSNLARAAMTLGGKCQYFQWTDSIIANPPSEAFNGVGAVINLMGENISNGRWTEEQKKKIYDSRIQSTSRLVETLRDLSNRPKVFISASAVGIYGNRGPEEITEESSTGDDFLAQVCKDWEAEANKASEFGMRVVLMRTGVVLGKGGGALAKMLLPFKLGVGGPIGSGEQYMSWIHVEDLALMYIETLKNEMAQGPYDGTAPYPATNKEFSRALGKVLRRPAFMPVPAFAVKAIFGEMSTILLEGQRVLPMRAKELQFRYRYPTLDYALKDATHK
jgi:uncharacterized protein (TIGR01777 family)